MDLLEPPVIAGKAGGRRNERDLDNVDPSAVGCQSAGRGPNPCEDEAAGANEGINFFLQL